LVTKANLNDTNSSNYVASTSNILVIKANLNDTNSSNYIASTSNILVDAIKNNKSSQWTTFNNNIYYNTSNVGIGTAVPSNKLHLYDDTTSNTKLTIQNNYNDFLPPYGDEFTTGQITNSTDRYIILTSSYSFIIPPQGINCDILMIGGGGTGGYQRGGGGGAGACIVAINQNLPTGTCTVTVGTGGVMSLVSVPGGGFTMAGVVGGDSIISINNSEYYKAKGGGDGGGYDYNSSSPGGCGAGVGTNTSLPVKIGKSPVDTNTLKINGTTITTGPTIQPTYAVFGNKGGDQEHTNKTDLAHTAGAGGGGIGTAGSNHLFNQLSGSAGGDGLYQVTLTGSSTPINFRNYFANGSTSFGVNDGTGNYYIGGGGGGNGGIGGSNVGGGGLGGGGIGGVGIYGHGGGVTGSWMGGPATQNTGSGGGGSGADAGAYHTASGQGGSGIVIIRYRRLTTTSISASSSIDFIRGTVDESNTDYSIGNYGGIFKIISSVSGTHTDRLVINSSSNMTFNGDINIIGNYKKNNRDVIYDTSNYVTSTSNILVNKANLNDTNSSNYIVYTSNILVTRANLNDTNSSNYIAYTSNILVSLATFNHINTSNYVTSTSNILVSLATFNHINTSNYVTSTSNILVYAIKNKISSQWLTSNNMIYYNTSNVGIGTNVPTSKLHLFDNTTIETKLIIQNAAVTLPTLINVDDAIASTSTIETTYRMLVFPYLGSGTTKNYEFTPTENIICDILVVGGGGGGGANSGAGGGGGGILFSTNFQLNSGSPVLIEVGNGGAGDTDGQDGRNGGSSSITINSVKYTANGGGGGGAGYFPGRSGKDGGSGGGAAHNNYGVENTTTPGQVNNTVYSNFQFYGNAGGYGKFHSSGTPIGSPAHASGGGGGAGSVGFNFSSDAGKGGGDGGAGKEFISYFGTNLGHNGWFAGGGGGNTAYNAGGGYTATYHSYGNGGVNLLGGGGNGGGSQSANNYSSAGIGLPNTGGGGGGSARIDTFNGAAGGSGIVIIRYRLLSPPSSSSLELIRGTSTDTNTDYSIGNYGGIFKIISSVSGTPTDRLVINSTSNMTFNGKIGVKMTGTPSANLHIGAGTLETGGTEYTHFEYLSSGLSLSTFNRTDVCAYFAGSIWIAGRYIASSDSRIKEEIENINDDSALNMILAVEPKTYKYIDKVVKGNMRVYGFIAQQIKEVIPEAVNIQKERLPNIMLLASYNNGIITLPSQPASVVIKLGDIIKCYDRRYKEIIAVVEEVIDSLTFRISTLQDPYNDSQIFVYGTEVDDFHTLSKEYIFTLNVCATQELQRRIEAQKIIIQSQEERIKDLEAQKVIIQSHEDRIKALEAKITQILNNMSQ
jgi:hypothetical protein